MDKKYDFSLSFDEETLDKDLEEEAAREAEERRRVAEQEARVQSAREDGHQKGYQEGYDAGKQEGIAEKSREIESLAAKTQKSIAAQLTDVAARQEEVLSDHLQSSLAAVMATLKALFPGFVGKHGGDEIEVLIRKCLDQLLDEPRVLIRVHPEVAAWLSEQIAGIAQQVGYGGKAVVIEHEGIALDACRIEWKDGLAERDSARTWQEVEKILERYIKTEDPVEAGDHNAGECEDAPVAGYPQDRQEHPPQKEDLSENHLSEKTSEEMSEKTSKETSLRQSPPQDMAAEGQET